MIVDHRAELDLLDLDGLLPLAGFGGFLLSGILVLPVVHDLADGRAGIRRNLDQIHASFLGHLDGDDGLDRAFVVTGLIDQLDLRIADIIIDARPVFAGSGRSFIRTANGWFSKVVKEAAILKEDAFAGKQVAYAKRKTLKCEAFWTRPRAR
ncbi:hypothetical protein JOE51_002062 [Bradyrhizobium japonicum]|nr:hypothetical protein [Bradyrhizobium japonicum]MBP1097170.1 hypothetical protein [Bradyrhizobium japonicum]